MKVAAPCLSAKIAPASFGWILADLNTDPAADPLWGVEREVGST